MGRLGRFLFIGVLMVAVGIHLKPMTALVGVLCSLALVIKPSIRFSFAGLIIPLAAVAGSGALIIPLLTLVATFSPRLIGFGGFFTGLLGVWTVSDYALHFPIDRLAAQGREFGWLEVWRALHTSPPSQFATISIFCTWFIGFELFNFLQAERHPREQFARGLCAGLALSCVVFALSLLAGLALPQEGAWWLEQGRRAATFSDPNAFGIASFLGVVLLFNQAKKHPSGWILSSLVGLSLLSLFSGSRSAVLGLFIFWGYHLVGWWITTRRKRSGAWGPLFVVLATSIGIGALLALFSTFGLISLARLQLTDVHSFIGSLQSRFIFWKVALEVFVDYPVIGVGLNRFGEVFVPYANALQLGTGVWTDNANSFYFWILAELGAVGAAIFAFELSRLKYRELEAPSTTWLPIFALLLVFGPHLHFLEVNTMSALLLAQYYQVRRANRSLVFLGLLIMPFVGFAIGAKTLSEPVGLYAWENDRAPFRWTERKGRFDVVIEEAQVAITFKVLNPQHANLDEGLSLRCGNGTPVIVTPHDGVTTTVRFSCPRAGLNTIFFELKNDWIPAQVIPGSNDYRALGMMLLDSPASHAVR